MGDNLSQDGDGDFTRLPCADIKTDRAPNAL
jgi:hypothetical protein